MIKTIYKLTESKPTMMEVDEELELIDQLMKCSITDILENKKDFFMILESFQTSHTQLIFSVNKEKYIQFLNFSQWLTGLSKHFDKNTKELISNISETMSASFT